MQQAAFSNRDQHSAFSIQHSAFSVSGPKADFKESELLPSLEPEDLWTQKDFAEC
jgi:hypothetical protein